MKNIAITGISGYIGEILASKLLQKNNSGNVIGIDIKTPQLNSHQLKFYCQDVSKPLDKIFIDNTVDTAINLAFIVKPTHNKNKAKQVDIGGISSFLDACVKAEVRNIIYLSSHTVYGAHPDNIMPVTEEARVRPLAGFHYSEDKVEAERILFEFTEKHRDISVTVLRSVPVIGPNAADSIVTAMFKSIMIRVAGYDPLMQFVQEDDMTNVIMYFIDNPVTGIYNIAGDGEIKYSQIARLRGKKSFPLPGKVLHFAMWLSWILRLQKDSPVSGMQFIKYPPVVSTEKIKNETGLTFRYSSKDALLSFIERKPSSVR